MASMSKTPMPMNHVWEIQTGACALRDAEARFHTPSAAMATTASTVKTVVSVRSRNEIGELADAFNRMAGQIEDSIRRLKQAAKEIDDLFLGTIGALAQAIDACAIGEERRRASARERSRRCRQRKAAKVAQDQAAAFPWPA